jgi:hypothetical protein
VRLKRLNTQLFDTLKSFYGEIERYRKISEGDTVQNEPEETVFASISDTERIVKEIKNFEKLKKSRLLID